MINLISRLNEGTLSLNNYDYTACLKDRVLRIKENLTRNGFETSVFNLQQKIIIRVPDGEIIFIGRNLMVKSNERSLRQLLINIIKS